MNNKKKKIVTIIGILFIWFGILLVLVINDKGDSIALRNNFYIFRLVFDFALIYGVFLLVRKIIKKTSQSMKSKFFMMLLILIVFLPFWLFFFVAITNGIYTSTTDLLYGDSTCLVDVMKVKDNQIIVDASSCNNNDPMIVEIHKPLFVKVQEGDRIHVKYRSNNLDKMHYILIDDDIISNFFPKALVIVVGFITIVSLVAYIVIFVYCIVNNKKVKKKKKR